MKKNQKGIIHLTLVLVSALILVVGFVGWRVTRHSQKSSTTVPATTQKAGTEIGKKELNGLTTDDEAKNSDIKLKSLNDTLGTDTSSTASEADSSVKVYVVSDGSSYEQIHNIQFAPENGKRYKSLDLMVVTQNIDVKNCTVTQKYIPDDPPSTVQNITLSALEKQHLDVYDGDHAFTAECATKTKKITATYQLRVADQFPEKCRDVSFNTEAVTANTTSALQSGIVGRWSGCVTTPWVPKYYVDMEFKADGTYTAVTDEVLDGVAMNAMYYGTQDSNPLKKYYINTSSSGEIDIVFTDSNTVNRDTLQNIKLMGNKLSFDMYHRGYGPLTFQLNRQ